MACEFLQQQTIIINICRHISNIDLMTQVFNVAIVDNDLARVQINLIANALKITAILVENAGHGSSKSVVGVCFLNSKLISIVLFDGAFPMFATRLSTDVVPLILFPFLVIPIVLLRLVVP
jgi:hypothetical protein